MLLSLSWPRVPDGSQRLAACLRKGMLVLLCCKCLSAVGRRSQALTPLRRLASGICIRSQGSKPQLYDL